MDKKRLEPKEITVENVHNFIGAYDEQVVHGIQQILMWFGANPKLERILWSYLKKKHIFKVKEAERISLKYRDKKKYQTAGKTVPPYDITDDCPEEEIEEAPEIVEPPPLDIIVGVCPKCSSVMKGMIIPGCETARSGIVFYKECIGCTYYVQTIRDRTVHREIEGGGDA